MKLSLTSGLFLSFFISLFIAGLANLVDDTGHPFRKTFYFTFIGIVAILFVIDMVTRFVEFCIKSRED